MLIKDTFTVYMGYGLKVRPVLRRVDGEVLRQVTKHTKDAAIELADLLEAAVDAGYPDHAVDVVVVREPHYVKARYERVY